MEPCQGHAPEKDNAMDMDKLVSLCSCRRGFIFPSSEIYGGPSTGSGITVRSGPS